MPQDSAALAAPTPSLPRGPARRTAVAAVVLALLACGIVLKLPVLQSVWAYWEDSYWFCLLAKSLEHGQYSIGGAPHGRFFPGYPLTLAALDLLSAGRFELPILAAWVSAVSGSLAVALCYPLYRRWGLGEPGVSAALVGMLLCAGLQLYSALPLYESFFLLIVIVGLLLESRGQHLAAALFAGLAMLVKPEGAFLVLGVALAAPTWGSSIACALIGSLPVLPWLARNWSVFGSPLATEYSSIYQGFATSGRTISGLEYLRHYPTFMGPLVILLALPSLPRLRRHVAALVYTAGTLLLHVAWPGDLERYVLPHAPIVFFLFGATIERLGANRPRRALVTTVVVLGGLFLPQYATRILAEVTRSSAYAAVAQRLKIEKGDFTALGADHAALQLLGGHFAFSAWQDLDRPAYLLVADLVRNQRLRYHLVTNYFHIDERFQHLREPHETDVILPGGERLHYRPKMISGVGHSQAEPVWLGLMFDTEPVLYEACLYEVSLLPP
jgi:hypothetical protein